MKKALKAAESRTIDPLEGKVDENDSTSDNEVGSSDANDSKTTADPTTSTMPITGAHELATALRPSPGRFGQLWRKERRCWSNFAHPTLRGMAASPGHEAVWRTLDRARIVGFVEHNDHNSDGEETLDDADDIQGMHAILEFRGDGFLLGQIPRILSSVIAMSNGWLPENFFEVATRPDIYVRTPPMPPFLDGRLYFHSSRYHFHELIGNTGGAFEDTIRGGSNTEKEWDKYLCNALLARASTNNKILEEKWLLQLRDEVSPDIQKQLEKVLDDNILEKSLALDCRNEKDVESPTQLYTTSPTGAFSATLDLLRDVVSSGKWPATSGARSRVIKSPSQGLSDLSTKSSNNILSSKKGAVASAFPGNGISSGSFTVMNEELWDSGSRISLPNANSFFPDLARSVFLLEKEIIEKSILPLPSADGMNRQSSPSTPRQPSTHCAVNRNAQFTPHVDSGRGQGQSLSMIVGLGNYTGGEILVEGNPYDIRYHALEFDGWKQLHWTAQFQGERYSLVWFSPEVQKESDQIDQVELSGKERAEDLSDEDQIAETLAIKHSKRLPFLSPLQFRKYSTDALVINEILDKEKGCGELFVLLIQLCFCFARILPFLLRNNQLMNF